MIAIETGVPVPTRRRRGPPTIYQFGAMNVGDSFALPVPRDATAPHIARHMAEQRVRCAAANWKRRRNRREVSFLVQFVETEGVVRCWRTA